MENKIVEGAVLLGAFWGLLKWTVARELKNIYATMNREFKSIDLNLSELKTQNIGHAEDLRDLDVRVSVLEVGGGRRKTDHCPSDTCPYEDTRPGVFRG